MAKKRRMPVKTTLVEMDDDLAGWVAQVRQNMTLEAYENIMKFASVARKAEEGADVDFGPIYHGLADVLVAPWNYVDEAGEPLGDPYDGPPPLNADGEPFLNADGEPYEGPWSTPTPASIRKLTFELLNGLSAAIGRTAEVPEA